MHLFDIFSEHALEKKSEVRKTITSNKIFQCPQAMIEYLHRNNA